MATNSLVVSEESRLDIVGDGLVSVKEAGRFLSYGHSKMYELMDKGQLPYVRIGGSRRIPVRAMKELAARHLHGGDQAGA